MRVLHLTSSYPRRDGDASGVFVHDLAVAQVAAGLDVHVLAPHDAGAATHEVLRGVHVRRFRYAPEAAEVLAHRGGLLQAVRRPSRLPLLPLFLGAFGGAAWREVRRLRPDVVHAHWWFPGGLVGALAGRSTPLVVTLHGSDVHLAGRGPLRRVARRVLARAEVVGAVSDALREEARGVLGAEVEVLRMPVVTAGVAQPIPSLPLRLVAIGRHAPEKGFDVLVAAIEGLDVELDLFGAGTEQLSRGPVRGHGTRSREEIAAALAAAHALVVPSRREGLGMVALEAMALGRPVVASAVGGLVETVADGVDGLLVPADDVAALRAALRRLPLPPPVGAAVARHAPQAVAAAHLAAYERAVSAPRR